MATTHSNTIIIGAGGAGLSCAAYLGKKGIQYLLLERHDVVAYPWHHHYDRLHLHTPKNASSLPFVPYPKSYPQYPSRDQVVSYFDIYCKSLDIKPIFNTTVQSVHREGQVWHIKTGLESYECVNLIIATGSNNIPHKIQKQGIESFPGKIIHSSEYANGQPYAGKNVLVVGFGNSACEIAIDLVEHGASPTLSVRSAVNIIPRDLFGISALGLGALTDIFPPRIADKFINPLSRLFVGDIRKLGLKKLPYGPKEQIIKYGRIPLLDIGTVKLIRDGKIHVRGDIKNIRGFGVQFENDEEDYYDAIIMATGYNTGLENIISIEDERIMDIKKPMGKRNYLGKDNIFFCGFHISHKGMFKEAAIEAKIVTEKIAG
jgi:lysine/ornithine N-monooxygenase